MKIKLLILIIEQHIFCKCTIFYLVCERNVTFFISFTKINGCAFAQFNIIYTILLDYRHIGSLRQSPTKPYL